MNACPDTNRTSPRAAKYGSVHWGVVLADVNKGYWATTVTKRGKGALLAAADVIVLGEANGASGSFTEGL
jgi:hypothetical protein